MTIFFTTFMALISLISITGALEKGVKNFKFRRRSVRKSDFDNPPDLRRYFDERGNVLSFGYQLPEKSYAIFKLPPLPDPTSVQTHSPKFDYNPRFFPTKNANRARKMISQQQKQEFENDKKSVEILLNGDEVKPSSVKQRQIVTKKEVQDKDKEIVRDSSNSTFGNQATNKQDKDQRIHKTLTKPVSVRIYPDPSFILASKSHIKPQISAVPVDGDKYSVTKEVAQGIPDSQVGNFVSSIKVEIPVTESTLFRSNYEENKDLDLETKDIPDDIKVDNFASVSPDEEEIVNQLVSISEVINVTLVDQSFFKNISEIRNSTDTNDIELSTEPFEGYEDEYEYYDDEIANSTDPTQAKDYPESENVDEVKSLNETLISATGSVDIELNSTIIDKPLPNPTTKVDFGSRNDSLPRHKKEIVGSKCNRDEIANVATLKQSFPECKKFASCENDADFSGFGYCLVRQYPETRSLTLAQTLTSGGGTVQFGTDEECTDFVHLFFPLCRSHIPSCRTVQRQHSQAILVLGCLFSQYTNLMMPLMSIGKEPHN